MLTARENLLMTLSPSGVPDRLVNQYQPFGLVMNDPVRVFTTRHRIKGSTSRDLWGTTIVWPEDQYAPMPHVTVEDKALPDITMWKKYLQVPDLKRNCGPDADWTPALKARGAAVADGKIVTGFMSTGIFEQAHFLMGFEDTLINFLAEPEYMKELLAELAEYRMTYARLLIENLKPEVILSHDDWGTKHSLFMSPAIWREFLKPLYAELYGMMKDAGVIVMHHADSWLEPIAEDLVDIGVDIWQGVLPQNDIIAIRKRTGNRLTLMGGIDAAIVDRAEASEADIRAEVRRACEIYGAGGHFIPCLTYGGPGSIHPHVNPVIEDEIDRFNAL